MRSAIEQTMARHGSSRPHDWWRAGERRRVVSCASPFVHLRRQWHPANRVSALTSVARSIPNHLPRSIRSGRPFVKRRLPFARTIQFCRLADKAKARTRYPAAFPAGMRALDCDAISGHRSGVPLFRRPPLPAI
jgi:hypothetical protein